MSQASNSSETDDRGASTSEADDGNPQEKTFECNICLDTAKDAVLSMCGHLFCWPCLHQWLEIRPTRQLCPVCKAAISKDKVIPVYGRGGTNKDPRDTLPPRPQGQRTEPENNTGHSYPGFGFGDGGFHMALSVGAFPFGLFTSTFNFGEPRPNVHGSVEPGPDATYSKFFLWIAIIFIIWLWTL